MTKVEVDLDDIDQIYINVFSAKSRLSCFANIANADADYDIIPSVENRHAAEVLSSDSSDSDRVCFVTVRFCKVLLLLGVITVNRIQNHRNVKTQACYTAYI